MGDDPTLVDRESVGNPDQIQIDRHVFVSGNDGLEDRRLIDIRLGFEEEIRIARFIVRVDLNQDRVPLDEVVVDGIVVVAVRRAFKDRLEHRCKFAVRCRAIDVAFEVIGDVAGEVLEPVLNRKAYGKAAAGDPVLLERRLHQVDHRLDDRHELFGGRGIAAAFDHAVVDQPGGVVERRAQHFFLEFETAKRDGELELPRRQ